MASTCTRFAFKSMKRYFYVQPCIHINLLAGCFRCVDCYLRGKRSVIESSTRITGSNDVACVFNSKGATGCDCTRRFSRATMIPVWNGVMNSVVGEISNAQRFEFFFNKPSSKIKVDNEISAV